MISVPAGAQIAKLRARRLSMLSRIGLGELIWPWMWPLHMMAVGSRRQRIESIPGASLAVTGGSGGEAPDKAIRRIGIATYAVQFLGTLAALLVVIFTAGTLQIVALIIAAALYGPVLVEGVAMLINISIRPGQLMLGHRRKQLAQGNQKVLILTSYVRDPVAPKGTARMLLTRLQRQWQAEKVVVIGYPANRALQRLYRDLGAIGDGWRGRRMKFDYRDQPSRPAEPLGARRLNGSARETTIRRRHPCGSRSGKPATAVVGPHSQRRSPALVRRCIANPNELRCARREGGRGADPKSPAAG